MRLKSDYKVMGYVRLRASRNLRLSFSVSLKKDDVLHMGGFNASLALEVSMCDTMYVFWSLSYRCIGRLKHKKP